ncbi:MAG: hypothetical protein GSR80_000950 [Desulfurococcales archaeon]|nr:hypothetical protein [Desulfurococcales archaeon]
MAVSVFVVGFGNVGREAVIQVAGRAGELGVRLAGAASSRGAVVVESARDLEGLVGLARRGLRLEGHPAFREGLGAVEAALEAGAEVALVAIPPSYESGEPNRGIYYGLIDSGVGVVTADKTLLALEYRELVSRARARGVCLGYRATVAAGTPAVDAARGLRMRGVERVRAVLNATSNYILGLVEEGLSYGEAVERAIEARLAEPDPRVDTHGWDAAAKLAILSNTLGYSLSLGDVERIPLEEIGEDEVRGARARGLRVKQVAEADYARGVYRVAPALLGAGDPLAAAEGEGNVIVFELEGSRVVLAGPAGPAWRTARVMVTDLAECLESRGASRV